MAAHVSCYYIGWTTPPKNLNAIIEYYDIENCSIITSWDPPDYVGGEPIQCYRLAVSYGEDSR